MNRKQQAVIVSAVRTPMGSFNGEFSPVPATTLGSIALLGEVLTPVQAAGGAIMLVALCAFQLRR